MLTMEVNNGRMSWHLQGTPALFEAWEKAWRDYANTLGISFIDSTQPEPQATLENAAHLSAKNIFHL